MATAKKTEMETTMTYEEAEKEAKRRCIMSGGNYRIMDGCECGGKPGFWYDRFDHNRQFTQEEGYAMTAVTEQEIKDIMEGK